MGSTVQESGSRSRPLDIDLRLPSSLPPTLTLAYAQIACSQLFQQKKSELNFKIRQRQQKLKNFHCAEGAPLCRSLPFIHTLTLSLFLSHIHAFPLCCRGEYFFLFSIWPGCLNAWMIHWDTRVTKESSMGSGKLGKCGKFASHDLASPPLPRTHRTHLAEVTTRTHRTPTHTGTVSRRRNGKLHVCCAAHIIEFSTAK